MEVTHRLTLRHPGIPHHNVRNVRTIYLHLNAQKKRNNLSLFSRVLTIFRMSFQYCENQWIWLWWCVPIGKTRSDQLIFIVFQKYYLWKMRRKRTEKKNLDYRITFRKKVKNWKLIFLTEDCRAKHRQWPNCYNSVVLSNIWK